MATQACDLYVDIENSVLYQSKSNLTESTLKIFYQGSSVPFRVFPIRPTGNRFAPFVQDVDVDSLGLRMYIADAKSNVAASTLDTSWTATPGPAAPDNATNFFDGELNLNTTELNSQFDPLTNSISNLYFQVQLSHGANWRTIYNQKITVVKSPIDPTSTANVPDPVSEYYTRTMADNRFLSLGVNGPGRTTTLQSPSGTYLREIGVDDNGNAIDNIVTA